MTALCGLGFVILLFSAGLHVWEYRRYRQARKALDVYWGVSVGNNDKNKPKGQGKRSRKKTGQR